MTWAFDSSGTPRAASGMAATIAGRLAEDPPRNFMHRSCDRRWLEMLAPPRAWHRLANFALCLAVALLACTSVGAGEPPSSGTPAAANRPPTLHVGQLT